MTKIDIQKYIPDCISSDIKRGLSMIRHGVARMIRIPAEDFFGACQKVSGFSPLMPFIPTVFGIPCNGTENALPEIIVVHDDDTNTAQNVKTELEVV